MTSHLSDLVTPILANASTFFSKIVIPRLRSIKSESKDSRPTKFLRNTNIQRRLVTFFILLSSIPLIIIGTVSYNKSKEAINTKISTYSVQVVDLIARNVQIEVSRIEYDSIDIVFSELVQDTLKHMQKLTKWERLNAENKMGELIVKKFSFLHDISDVIIYANDQQRINAYGDTNIKFKLKPMYLGALLSSAIRNQGRTLWSAEGESNVEQNYNTAPFSNNKSSGILMTRSFKSLEDGEQLGVVLIRINERFFSSIYQNADIGTEADIFIIDSDGIVISSRNAENIVSSPYKDHALIQELKHSQHSGENTFTFESNGLRYLTAYSYLENPGWYVVSLIPYAYLNAESNNIGKYTVILGILCILLAVFISLVISRSISVPLNRLMSFMKKVEGGDLTVNIKDTGKDEIGSVTSSFNNMVDEVRKLMVNVKDKERQKRAAELKTLQAQINPHFLSNTLNAVKTLADVQGASNISSLVSSLIKLLHVSMGKGDEIVSLKSELDYLKNYITIQEYRYYDKFRIFYDIDERILDCRIIRFTLQPIIENAIIHGIGPIDGQGIITLKGFADGDKIRLTITDNGSGIPQAELVQILSDNSGPSKMKYSSIGIKNVNERLRMYYGDEYGLSLHSMEGVYTTVEIVIPMIREGGAGNDESIDR